MSPPQGYEALSQILIDKEQPAEFVEKFNLLVSPEVKTAILYHDYYRIYTCARYNIDPDQFDKFIEPFATNFKDHQLDNLFTAAKNANHVMFARFFATVPIHDRLKLLQADNCSLYNLLKIRLQPEEFAGVLNQLPDPLSDSEDSPFIQNLSNARTAFNSANLSLFNHLIYQDPISPPQPIAKLDPISQLGLCIQDAKFNEFLQLLNAQPSDSRIQLLAADDAFLYKSAYSIFSEQQILQLFESLPLDPHQENDKDIVSLITQTRDAYKNNVQKSKNILGKLFLRATPQACMNHEILKLPIYMGNEDFLSFLQKQTVDYLVLNYTTGVSSLTTRNHPLYDVLLSQGSTALMLIVEAIFKDQPARLITELRKSKEIENGKEYLYESLIKYPGAHRSRVAEIIAPKIPDAERSSLVQRYYQGHMSLPWEIIFLLLRHMTDRTRLHLLLIHLSDPEQTILIESIAADTPAAFLETLALFDDPVARYIIYSQPVKYGVKRQFTEYETANFAAETLSSAVYYLPGFGNQAKQTVDSYQVQVDVSEFLLCRMLRLNPHIKPRLLALLGDLKAPELTVMLRAQDSKGKSVLMYVLEQGKKEEIVQILAVANYSVPDNQKVVNASELDITNLRAKLESHADSQDLVGFMAFLGLYNYISSRATEANDINYQERKDDFFDMLSCLNSNRTSGSTGLKLKEYCEKHPLTKPWGFSLASSSLKLGTNRYMDARNKLLLLNTRELQKGLILFEEFISQRVNRATHINAGHLDKCIQSQFKSKATHRMGSLY
jgi:hypothetical protein